MVNISNYNVSRKACSSRFWILLVSAMLLLGLAVKPFADEILVVPTGTSDDASMIQNSLDNLQSGDTLKLSGNFVIAKTIYLPSNITWILDGTMVLSQTVDLDSVGWQAPGIDARRSTAITETPGGATNIEMSGGTYNGFNILSGNTGIRLINFVSVTNSYFHDFNILGVSDDQFTLGPGSNGNEVRNLVGTGAGGNALTDKGDYNKWYDCIAEDAASDGWTPKCRNSEFYRCIARRNEGPGFGMYCRIDGSGDPIDLGEAIEGNKFYDCEAYENNAAGFSFNISSTSGEGGTIRNNYVQAICYNNASSGVRYRNKMPNSIIENNQINIVTFGNRGELKSGGKSSLAGGLGTEATYPVIGITGSMVSFDNVTADVNINQATGSSITVYHPDGQNPPVIKEGDASNSISIIGFNCSDTLDQWCMQTYCGLPSCGDGTCDPNETACNCPDDCGVLPVPEENCTDGIDNDCDGNVDCNDSECAGESTCTCGNGICDSGENCNSCSEDCISRDKPAKFAYCCGDGTCGGQEDGGNCAVDCGASSECDYDGTCEPAQGENPGNCPLDCTGSVNEDNCTDGIDNDGDGNLDCSDSDCTDHPDCSSSCMEKGVPCSSNEECCSSQCHPAKETCK